MLTHKLNGSISALAVGLILASLGQQAAAMDEIIVYGSEQAALAKAVERLFETETDQYLRTLGSRFKAALGTRLELVPTPELQLASGELATRG